MITKRVVVNQREITANGVIQVRLSKELVEDGKILSSEYHRTTIMPGESVKEKIKLLNDHLVKMGWTSIEDEGIETIRRVVELEHTKPVIEKFAAQEILE